MRDLSSNSSIVRKIEGKPSLCHASSLVVSAGRALCVWYEGSYETSPDTVIKISRREARGEWSAAETLVDFHGAPLGNPVLWKTEEKAIHITYSVLTEESWVSSLLFYASSYDGGDSWSRPSLFLSRSGFMGKTQPLLLEDGRILFPLYHEADYCPYLFLIDDLEDPRAGTLVAETMARKKAIQPSICRADRETLLMLCRTNQGRIWRSLSFNDGLSWSILRPTGLPNPDSAVDVTNWRGKLLLCYNPSESQRDELRLATSTDRGASWRDVAEIAKGDVEYSYPSLYVDEKDTVHLTFTDNRYAIRHLPLSASVLGELLWEGGS